MNAHLSAGPLGKHSGFWVNKNQSGWRPKLSQRSIPPLLLRELPSAEKITFICCWQDLNKAVIATLEYWGQNCLFVDIKLCTTLTLIIFKHSNSYNKKMLCLMSTQPLFCSIYLCRLIWSLICNLMLKSMGKKQAWRPNRRHIPRVFAVLMVMRKAKHGLQGHRPFPSACQTWSFTGQ